MCAYRVSDAEIKQFNEDGFIMVPGLFDQEETDLLYRIGKADKELAREAYDSKDASGRVSKLSLRNDLGDDIYSACVRSERIAGTMEKLMGDEVYHYHHKMMLKEPLVGGAWEWHQDYGYWYKNGFLFPHLASCMIAVDRSNRENGCLQVIKGSHHMGRIEHAKTGLQTGANLEVVEQALKRMELVYAEMEPGTGLFFHSNLLHCSDENTSPNPRWTLICCYNTKKNDPFKSGGHPNYNFMDKWPDSRVKEVGQKQWDALKSTVEA